MVHSRSRFDACFTAVAATCVAISANAQVRQPAPFVVNGIEYDTVPVDQRYSSDYYPDQWGPGMNDLGLGILFDQLEGGLVDYQLDAAIEPAVFSPLCGLKGSMILRGGSCRMDFGWYCVDDPSTFVPLVTSAEVLAYHDGLTGTYEQYKNNDKGFVPLIGMPPVEGAPLESVRESPAFLNCPSQQIGFTIVPTGDNIPSAGAPVCTQQKYSQASLNMKHALTGQPWISALTYGSKSRPGVFYVAFEDLPSSPTEFNPPTGQGWVADGDFNDFVYMVEGILCEGGGQICDTRQPGKCGIGVTECTVDGTPGACTPRFQPEQEECNNIDDDCDGLVDGDGLCPPEAPRCFEGTCVADCGGGEFPCEVGYECDSASGLCVESGCIGVVCAAEQVCKGGACVGGCEGVTCLPGLTCVSGECLDLCQGQVCPSGFVCEKGACIPDCHCLPCTDPTDQCGDDGKCIDTACLGVTCPEGQHCNDGVCNDPCSIMNCLEGQICQVRGNTGVCVADYGIGSGGTGIEVIGTGGNPRNVDNVGDSLEAPVSRSGCGCRSAASNGSGSAAAVLLLLGIAFVRRRRR